MNLKKILLFILVFPTIIVGQNNNLKLDSIFDMNLIDMSKRIVYQVAETNPTLINGNEISTFFYKNPNAFELKDCCAFRVYIGFVVEVDGSITNKKVFVKSVFSKEKGLIYSGQELSEIQQKVEKLLDKIPQLTPGKLNGKNVAIRVLIPLHLDCRKL